MALCPLYPIKGLGRTQQNALVCHNTDFGVKYS